MPIFRIDNRIVLFAHVPKSGGTTVNHRLREANHALAFFDGTFWTSGKQRWFRSSPQHITNADRDLLFTADFYDYSFAVVRDPIQRFLSAFNHNRGRIGYWVSLPRFLSRMERRVAARDDYFGYQFDNHFVPAARIVPPDARVFRLEDGLDAVFAALEQDLGIIPPPEVGLENQRSYEVAPGASPLRSVIKKLISSPSLKSHLLTDDQLERIRILYREDIQRFYPETAPLRTVLGVERNAI